MPDLEANGEMIDVHPTSPDDLSAPSITDWNNDGLLDLVLGATPSACGYGVTRLYINSGSPGNPVLTDYSLVFCGNDTIKYRNIDVEVADLDMDGLKDIMIGQYRRKPIFFHKNIGTAEEPVFNQAESLNVSVENHTYCNSSACVYDWDDNGAPDLLIGDYYGCIYRFMNKTPVEIKVNKPIAGYKIPKNIGVSVFDVKGRLIGSFDKQDYLPNGMYNIKVSTNNSSFIRKVMIIK